jgi:hypothetical protein
MWDDYFDDHASTSYLAFYFILSSASRGTVKMPLLGLAKTLNSLLCFASLPLAGTEVPPPIK